MGDAAQDIDAKGDALDTAKDLFAGAAGGVAQVLIGRLPLFPTSSHHGAICHNGWLL